MGFKSVLAGLLLLLPCSAIAEESYWEPHFQSRNVTIAAQVALLGTGDIMLLGDSNTEMFWWNINSCNILNAGFGGARIRHIAERSQALAALARPKIVHIMIGTNNLATKYRETPDGMAEWNSMQADITTIVEAFQSVGAIVVLWPVPPFENGNGNLAERAAINTLLNSVRTAKNTYWDWWWPNTITQGPNVAGFVTSGYAVSGALLGDGVHLSPSSQISRFYRLTAWYSTIHAQTGVACN